MGKAIREIKAVRIAGRLQRRIETRIAETATVIVHRLICPSATDAGSGSSGRVATPARQQDFGGGVKKRIDGNCLHRGRLTRSWAQIGALKIFAMAGKHATRDRFVAHVPGGSKARGTFEFPGRFSFGSSAHWEHLVKLATYNVNGINGRLPVLLRWLEEDAPDIVCLQELKSPDERFPRRELQRMGYEAVWHGQKSWNGVAILARHATPVLTRRGLPGAGRHP